MSLPDIKIRITADPSGAKAGIDQVVAAENALSAATEKAADRARKLDAAFARGSISAKAHATALSQLENELQAAATKATAFVGATAKVSSGMGLAQRQSRNMGNSMAIAGHHVGNLGAQLNDVGTMLLAGQSPLMLAVQQGTQINQVFSQMGGGRKAIQGLAQAFTSLINPLNLATIGVIAGGAALVQWASKAFGASEEARAFEERLDSIREKIEALQSANEASAAGVTEDELFLITEIEKVQSRIIEMQERLATVNRRERRYLRLKIENEKQALAELEAQLDVLKELSPERQRERKSADDLLATMRNQNRLARMTLQHGADSVQVARERALQEYEAKIALIESMNASEEMKIALRGAAAEAYNLANADITSGITSAADEAARLADELFRASRVGLRQTLAGEDLLFSQDVEVDQAGATRARNRFLQMTRRDGGRGGGGGGGGGADDARGGRIESLLQSLQTERETLQAWYEESKQMLASAQQSELNMHMTHQEALARLTQEYQQRRGQIEQAERGKALSVAANFFGSMAQLAAVGGKKTLGVVKALSIAESLINSYKAFTQVLGDPFFIGRPFLRNVAAASVLASGLAQVANIKGVGGGGGGGGGVPSVGGAASAGGGAAAAAARGVHTGQTFNITLAGDNYSGGSIRALLAQMNEVVRDGTRIQVAP